MLVIKDRPGAPSVATMRTLFEQSVQQTPALERRFPLGVMEVNGAFSHYMDDHTDTAWIGFAIGMRAAQRIADTGVPAIAQDRDDAHTQAARDLLAERLRQISSEGWTTAHDDAHTDCSMSRAAACYALDAAGYTTHHLPFWPWGEEWWKPREPRRNLVKAAALILAEIERIDRVAARAAKGK